MQINRFTSSPKPPRGGSPKASAVIRDVAIDTGVASLSAAAGWGLARVNPFLAVGAGAVIGFVAPRGAASPYAEDGVLARPASALFGALCAAGGAFGGPVAIPVAGTFGAFRACAGHTLYPGAR